jgi:hypothetical protein
MVKKYRIQIAFLIVGIIIGFLVFHPYTMLVYSLMNIQSPDGGEIHFHGKDLFALVQTTFNPMMLPMAISFAPFNGIIGLLIGILIDKRKRLEQKKIALETLNRLMITLSHYLLNANAVIGGMVRHCKRIESNKDLLCSLEVIEEHAKKIDAVIKALKEITEIKTADYTTKGKALMIDITSEIEELLNEPEKKKG